MKKIHPTFKSIVFIILVIFLNSCGPNIEELAKQNADNYLKDLSEIRKDQPLHNLVSKLNSVVYRNEQQINDLLSTQEIEAEDKEVFNQIISQNINDRIDDLSSYVQKKKKEGYNFMNEKKWILKDKEEQNFYRGIFTVKDSTLTFLNIKGSYKISLGEKNEESEIDGSKITFEKLNDKELKIVQGTNSAVFVEAKDDDLILGKWSGSDRYLGQTAYFSLVVTSHTKGIFHLKADKSSKYKISVKSSGNGKYYISDKGGSIPLKYSDGFLRGKLPPFKLNLKRTKSETAYSANSIFSGYTKEDSKNNQSQELSLNTTSGSKDWDKMLNDYEDYVVEYLKFYKKAMEGDYSAISKYPALMQKATALQQSIAKAQNDNELSATQVQRMLKIQIKMTNAALEMQN